MRPRFLLIPVAVLASPATILAQIVTDGTAGPKVTLSGKAVEVGAGLGTQSGSNLFHSFEAFNVNRGQTVTFTGPDSVRNVVGRVTGATASSIDGTLRSTVGQADVYFVNPAGVTFGPTAVVDVPAGLHVGTAHEVRFADGARFSALDKSGSSFTTAPPEAFGFLDRPIGPLTVNQTSLATRAGMALSLVGGDVEVSGGSSGRIEAPGGAVTVASIAGPGNLRIADGTATATKRGKVRLNNGARLTTTGNGGGRIKIRGGRLLAEGAQIVATNTGAMDATGSLDVEVETLDVSNSLLGSGAVSTGDGVPIQVRAGTLALRNAGEIFSWTDSRGNAGPVAVEAGALTVAGASATPFTGIVSRATPASTGAPGAVRVRAGSIDIFGSSAIISNGTQGRAHAGPVTVETGRLSLRGDNGVSGFLTGIGSNAFAGATGGSGATTVVAREIEITDRGQITGDTYGTGPAGAVTVRVPDGHVALSNRGFITSDTYAVGDGGTVTVEAGTLSITGTNGQGFTGIASNAIGGSSGDAGKVDVTTAGELVINDGGEIGSNTFSIGDAGSVRVHANTLSIIGNNGKNFTGIGSIAAPGSRGHAGTVDVTAASQLAISQGGEIGSSTFGLGDAGRVTVRAGSLMVTGNNGLSFTGIASNAIGGSIGDAGTVDVTTAGQLTISNAGEIGSTTSSLGNAGTVTVNAGTVSIIGNDGRGFTGVSSNAIGGSSGDAGTVKVTTVDELAISHGGEIGSNTSGIGDAGDVTIQAGSLAITGVDNATTRTGIGSNAEATSRGRAGTVDVTTAGQLTLSHGGSIGSNTFSSGDAGSVRVHADTLSIIGNNGQNFTGISSSATPNSSGDAGSVRVTTAGQLAISNTGEIGSNTFGIGNAGDVVVQAGSLAITGVDGATTRTGIGSTAEATSRGRAGTVDVTTAGQLAISHGGEIGSNTFSLGDAGSVRVHADTLSIIGTDGRGFTGISSAAFQNSSGDAGTVDVTATGEIAISRTGEIGSNTFGIGNAGDVVVRAGSLSITGIDSATTRTGISSSAERSSNGDAGTVDVTAADQLTLSHGGEIGSNTFSIGDAGSVRVHANTLSIIGNNGQNFTGIGSVAAPGSRGHAGTIDTTAASALDIRSGGSISSSTFSFGDAGSVIVRANLLALDGGTGAGRSEIASRALLGARGGGGAIEIHSGHLTLGSGAAVVTQSDSLKDAGNILIDVREAVTISTPTILPVAGLEGISSRQDVSGISSAATAGGDAGRITITAGDQVTLHNGVVDSTSTFAGGGQITVGAGRLLDVQNGRIVSTVAGDVPGSDAGDITIASPFLVLDNARIQANAKGGNGGDVRIGSDRLVQTPNSLITATSERALSGNIVITAPDVDVGSTLVALPESFLSARDLLRDSCAGRSGQAASSLTFSSGGGLPLDPAGPLPSLYTAPSARPSSAVPPWSSAAITSRQASPQLLARAGNSGC